MSALPEGIPVAGPDACPVCGTPVATVLDRCPGCGYALAGLGPRPGAYSRTALVWTIVAFVAIYAVILGVVALTN